MAKSLQEQLMGAGLVDQKKAKAIKQEKRKQKKQEKQQPKTAASPDNNHLAKEREDKKARDRELNRQRLEKIREKEIQAQIVQMIGQHSISRDDGDIAYQFVDDKKIRKIYVSAEQQAQLAAGRIAVVKCGERFELVPRIIAEKIAQRNAEQVLVLNDSKKTQSENDEDPYADYKIPDDLMW